MYTEDAETVIINPVALYMHPYMY